MMSRKHYQAIADVIAAELAVTSDDTATRALENVTASIADVMARDNATFQRRRFYVAALGRPTVRAEV